MVPAGVWIRRTGKQTQKKDRKEQTLWRSEEGCKRVCASLSRKTNGQDMPGLEQVS